MLIVRLELIQATIAKVRMIQEHTEAIDHHAPTIYHTAIGAISNSTTAFYS